MRCVPGLLALSLIGCGEDDPSAESRPVTIRFAARAGEEAVTCGQSYGGMGRAGPVELRDFRLYASDVRLVSPDGTERPLELEQDGVWQSGGIALLDFEDGTGACSETGNAEMRTEIRGVTSLEAVGGLRFRLGVPFDRNHLDTAAQPSPLNILAMHWNWRGGYKFLRLDLRDVGVDPSQPYNIHLGSTGCTSPAPVAPPSAPCGRPNRPEVVLDRFDPGAHTVVFDVGGLLDGVDTSTNTVGTNPGCMSGPNDAADCTPIFENLGLSFDTGACRTEGCADQRFVRVE